MALLGPVRWLPLVSLLRQARPISTTTCLRGLEEFLDKPVKEGEVPQVGRAWKAADLRQKSWDDLHKLWYVMLKERNMLQSEKLRYKAQQAMLPNPTRLTKVRKGMNRIKVVLSERQRQEQDEALALQMKQFLDAL